MSTGLQQRPFMQVLDAARCDFCGASVRGRILVAVSVGRGRTLWYCDDSEVDPLMPDAQILDPAFALRYESRRAAAASAVSFAATGCGD